MNRRSRWQVATATLLAALLSAGCTGSGSADDPGPGGGRTVEVWAVGDGPNGKADAKAVADMIAEAEPDRLIYLGDVYGDYATRFDESFGAAGLREMTLPTPGNHEWPSQREEYLRYWADTPGAPQQTHYAVRLGNWQILSLNSEEPVEEGSAQYEWLRATLGNARGTCRLAFFHRPRWSAGRHGDEKDLSAVWDALVGHAVLAVSGHDHTMQRLRPIDGITQMVSGSGGRNFYPLDRQDPRLRFGNNTDFGALSLRLSPSGAEFEFVSVDGSVLDSGRVPCDPA